MGAPDGGAVEQQPQVVIAFGGQQLMLHPASLIDLGEVAQKTGLNLLNWVVPEEPMRANPRLDLDIQPLGEPGRDHFRQSI